MADDNGGAPEPSPDLYRLHVEEYRFQVELNWKRTQYFIVLNAAILSVGVGLIPSSGTESVWPVIGIFVAGACMAVLSIFATMRQHEYYRNTRDAMTEVGEALQLGVWSIRTTRAMRSSPTGNRLVQRLSSAGRVTTVTYIILSLFAIIEVAAIMYLLFGPGASPTIPSPNVPTTPGP